MLIDSDFERHKLIFITEYAQQGIRHYLKRNGIKNFKITLRSLPKHMQLITLTDYDNKLIDEEVMWSPEQLRLFLIKNGIIA